MVARTFRATRTQAAGQRRSLNRQKTAHEKRLTELRKGIGRLVRAAGDRDDGPLADELRKLNDEYTDVETQVQQFEAQLDRQEDVPTEHDVAEALRTVEPLWSELFPAEKERIVRLLVETVSVRPDGLTIRLRPTGLVTLAAEVAPQEAEEPEPQEATA